MNRGDTTMSFVKLSVATLATGATTNPLFRFLTESVSFPVWGVPVSVIGAAACGAGLSLFFGDPLPTRRALYGQVVSATIFGTAVAVLLADGMDWDWAQKNIGMFALMSAAMMRWFLPSMIERGKQLVREFKLPSIRKSDDGETK